jgi:uncharacterized cupin superfamily protein
LNALKPFAASGDTAWVPIAADKVIAGEPAARLWVHYEDAAQKLSAGEWEATPGKWRISYSEWDWMLVISGTCIVTGDDGSRIDAGPGTAFVIEPGFSGIWEVTRTMRKHWVIRE